MTRLQGLSPEGSGHVVINSAPLGKGGEGSVFEVTSHTLSHLPPASSLVAKIYHQPQEGDREKKVMTMITAPPHSTSVAWANCLLRDDKGSFVGFLMPKIDMVNNKTWAQLSHLADRRKTSAEFDVRYAIMACRNLASAMNSIHNAGHAVGDVNESNIMVSNSAQVTIVDTDSAQVKAHDGTIYPCLVGKPDYTAPELTHGSLKNHQRTVATDVFGYAVAVFQMLTGGAHPTNGKFLGAGDPPGMVEKIRKGIYPGLSKNAQNFQVLPRVPLMALPSTYRTILRLALSTNPSERPGMVDIINAQDAVLSRLKQCSVVKTHWYDTKDGDTCTWCAWAKTAPSDPWNVNHKPAQPTTKKVASPEQKSLPTVSFGSNDAPIAAKRVSTTPTPTANRTSPVTPSHIPPANSSHTSGYPNTPTATPSTPLSTKSGKKKPSSPYQKPQQVKGKTVFTNSMGQHIVRPSLGVMFKNGQGALATKAFLMELPEIMKPWWVYYRPFPNKVGFWFSPLIILAVALSWFYIIPLIYTVTGLFTHEQLSHSMVYSLGLSIGGTILFGSGFWFSMIPKLRSHKKHFSQYQPHGTFATIGYTFCVSVFYGIGLVLALIACAMLVVVHVITAFLDNLGKK